MIRDLPAVEEARQSGGVFSVAYDKALVHPNKDAAYRVVYDGRISPDKVPFLLHTRELSDYEKEYYRLARQSINHPQTFFGVRVVDTHFVFILTFAGYLLLDETTLKSRYLPQIIAHEIGHMLNGDTFVKAGLWFLGRGWTQESMTPFGMRQETPEQQFERTNKIAERVTFATLRGGWLGLGLSVAGELVNQVGGGVKGLDVDITRYFHKWDLQADAVAETITDRHEYQAYLADLVRNGDRFPFDAPPAIRLEHSERRSRAGYTPPTIAPIKTSMPIWKVLVLVFTVGLGGLMLLSVLLLMAQLSSL